MISPILIVNTQEEMNVIKVFVLLSVGWSWLENKSSICIIIVYIEIKKILKI